MSDYKITIPSQFYTVHPDFCMIKLTCKFEKLTAFTSTQCIPEAEELDECDINNEMFPIQLILQVQVWNCFENFLCDVLFSFHSKSEYLQELLKIVKKIKANSLLFKIQSDGFEGGDSLTVYAPKIEVTNYHQAILFN